MTRYFYIYDSFKNEALKQDIKLSGRQFSKSVEKDFYMVTCDDQFIGVENTRGEFMRLTGVTKEQAVILMDALLGMKETAKEDA